MVPAEMNLCDYQLDGSESLPAPTRLNTLILISFFLQGCLSFITFFFSKRERSRLLPHQTALRKVSIPGP